MDVVFFPGEKQKNINTKARTRVNKTEINHIITQKADIKQDGKRSKTAIITPVAQRKTTT